MAYNANASVATGNNETRRFGNKEEAKGFLNMYLPIAGGGRVKFGGLACRDEDKGQKLAMDYLRAAADEADFKVRLITLINKMEFEFNWVEKKEIELAL